MKELEMHQFFLKQCEEWGELSKCDRLKVGCVITRDDRVVVTGVNGTLPGKPNCCEENGQTAPGVIHAEQNAICYAARKGITLEGSTLYCRYSPCAVCASLVIQCGVTRVVYAENYRDQEPITTLRECDIEVIYAGIQD